MRSSGYFGMGNGTDCSETIAAETEMLTGQDMRDVCFLDLLKRASLS